MKQRYHFISLLRIFATVAVVYLHTCSTVLYNYDLFPFTIPQDRYLTIGHDACCWAVPVFLMISGFLLLPEKKGTPEKKKNKKGKLKQLPAAELTYAVVLKKYVLRIFLALTLFSVPYAVIKLYMESGTVSPSGVLEAYLTNGSLSHLWYLYALIGIYLVLPILKPALNRASDRLLLQFLCVLFLFSFVIPTIGSLLEYEIRFEVPLTYPLFYFIVGYYFRRAEKRRIFRGWLSMGIALVCLILVAVLVVTRYYFYLTNTYYSPLTAIFSMAMFTGFQDLITGQKLSEKGQARLWKLDRLCFGAYLVHPVFIQFTYRLLDMTPVQLSWWPAATFVFCAGFAVLAFFASWVMNLIPPLRKYVL